MILLSKDNDHLQNINANILFNNNLRIYSITTCLCININYCIFHGYICDRILENGSKSHMKSIVFQHVFNCISTYAYVFPKYLYHNFDNLSIKFHVMI